MTGRSTAWVRPQPIRDAILAYLTELRSARDIALHIDRPVPTATGHLAAMRRRGLAKRIAYATYAPPDWPEAAETMGQLARSQPTRTAILEYLTEPRSVRDIALHIDPSRETTGSHLTDMRRRGLIKRVGYGVYAPVDWPEAAETSALARSRPIRDAILEYLTEPRAVREIAMHIKRGPWATARHLTDMRRRGLIKCVGDAVYALPDWPVTAEQSEALVKQQPIDEAILAHLSEPRRRASIAPHAECSVSTLKRHLVALCRRGLLKRIGRGVYALPDSSAEAELTTPSHSVAPPALCQHIAALPARHRSVEDLALEPSEAEVEAALNDSWLHNYSVSTPVEPTRRLLLADRILSHAVRSASG